MASLNGAPGKRDRRDSGIAHHAAMLGVEQPRAQLGVLKQPDQPVAGVLVGEEFLTSGVDTERSSAVAAARECDRGRQPNVAAGRSGA
jgi:hypothetical protein